MGGGSAAAVGLLIFRYVRPPILLRGSTLLEPLLRLVFADLGLAVGSVQFCVA